MKVTETGMMTGINQVGPGWHPLVRKLEADLDALSQDWELQQIKEKFGGLRFYLSIDGDVPREIRDQMYELTMAAEAKSFELCELCGETPVPQTTGGWIKTLCAKHREDHEKTMAEFRKAMDV